MLEPRRITDLTRVFGPDMPVFAGYPAPEIAHLAVSDPERDPVGTVHSSHLSFGLHAGTHLDAPRHFAPAGRTIDAVALVACVGPATLLDLRSVVPRAEITAARLAPFEAAIRQTRRAVLCTGWGARWGEAGFFTDFPVISADAAQLLLECGVLLVGLDTPSLDHPPFPAHVLLLGHDVVVLENLANLDDISTDIFVLVAAPLPLAGCEASPVRAFALEV